MKAFLKHRGQVVPVNRGNIDTDAILPKQYLKKLEKTGYGDFLFDDERYLDPGDVDTPTRDRRVNKNFVLNQEPYVRGTILLAQANFGCGSSREHAVWALLDFGIRVVIAPSFGEIFYTNCFNNGLLPIVSDQSLVDELFQRVSAKPDLKLRIDLENTTISCGSDVWPFKLEEGRRQRLLQGLDEIGMSLEKSAAIRQYEAKRHCQEPWIFHGLTLNQ